MRTRLLSRLGALIGTVSLAFAVHAAPPADAPPGTMGLCKDGSYSAAASKRGACRGHKGIKEWYAADAPTAMASAPKATAMQAPSMSTATPPAPSPTTTSTAPSATPAPSRTTTTTATTTKPAGSMAQPAPGGGPGMVWVNTDSKVYHCTGSRWYGKSKQGTYMSEAEAKTQGNRPSHGKACAA